MLNSMKWIVLVAALASNATAQETDVTQTPNAADAGIKKSYAEQIGAGRGDVMTPDSSAFIIARDPFRAIARGRQLFQRKFTHSQGVGPRTGDGVGDIEADGSLGAGLSDSCASCHGRPQGSAGFGGDVFTRPTSRDAPHLFGLGLQEMLADEITKDLRAIRAEALAEAIDDDDDVTLELESKGISYGTITAYPDGSFDTSGVEGVDANLRVRPFFAQGGTISIREFLVGAFNAEMGLESADADLLAAANGIDIVTPSGMSLPGTVDAIEGPPALDIFDDPDLDGVVDEIPVSVVDYMEFYLLNYFKPGVRSTLKSNHGGHRGSSHGLSNWNDEDDEDDDDDDDDDKSRGLKRFEQIGCASCHVPHLTIDVDRRVADVETVLDRVRGNPFNNLHATAVASFQEVDDGSGFPTLKQPLGDSFVVRRIFADFKRHDLGPNFWEKNFDGSLQKEFITEPLWGVGSSAPYGHDGRSPTLADVILRHGGEAQDSRDEFADLSSKKQKEIVDYLGSLVLFSPPSTASNLNGADHSAVDYPVNGHGSIDLAVLFNDPTDKE